MKKIVGVLVIIGFFATLGLLLGTLFFPTPIDFPPGVKEVLLILIGVLAAKFGTIVDHAYGSSEGSEKKTEIMAREHELLNGRGQK
ncbi:MAG: hypothetical protein QXL01_03220 [Thermoplasmatales archaeon]